MLIHCGIDTVQLEGKPFVTHVEQGDMVKKGTLMLEFDIDEIQKSGYSIETPVLVTNLPADKKLEMLVKGDNQYGCEAIKITE